MSFNQAAFYNPAANSVDIKLNRNVTLRLDCPTIFKTVETTDTSYQRMIRLSQENPGLFAELALDYHLESYLNALE